jgi:Transcriptional Coactivator p15 (PC4).
MSETDQPVTKKLKQGKDESVEAPDKLSSSCSSSSSATPTAAIADKEEIEEEAVEHETNEQGEQFFDLTGKKRFTVRKWKGKVLLDIREFYESNGEMKPGKKGISLNLEQYKILSKLVKSGSIDAIVKKHNGTGI